MDFEAQQQINRHINPNEGVVWAGRPKRGVVFHASDIFLTIFAIFWLAATVPAFLAALQAEDTPVLAGLFLLPFLVIGLYLLLGRLVHDAWRRSRTYYGLTDKRVIIMSGWFRAGTTSIPLKSLPSLQLKEKSNGSGTIIFGTGGFGWMAGMYWPGMSSNTPPTIELVDAVRSVYDQILAAQQSG